MAAMSRGCLITNKGKAFFIKKNGLTVKFNEEIRTKNSFVCGVILAAKPDVDYSLAMVATANWHRPQDINNLHKKLGHVSEALV